VQGRLCGFAHETVAAVYRAAIHAANELQDEGQEWLRSEAGIAYRRRLGERAYDALPASIRGVPIGLVRMVVSRELVVELVQHAFQEITELAERLELPEEVRNEPVIPCTKRLSVQRQRLEL
jgi:hypothetical protein